MPGDLSDPQDALEERLAQASARVEALEGFSFDTARLRRMLDEARDGLRRGMPLQAGGLADDLETRLRMAEEELRETAQAFFKSSWKLSPSAELSAESLRRTVLEETLGLIQSTLASQAFRELTEAAASATAREVVSREASALGERVQTALAEARESVRSETAGVARELRASAADAGARLTQLEAAVTRKVEETLKEDNTQAALDAETAERQMASLEASAASLEERLRRLEAAPRPEPAPAQDLSPLERRTESLERALSALAEGLKGEMDAMTRVASAAAPAVDLGPLLQRTERLERALEGLATGLRGEVDALVQQAAVRALAPLLKDMADRLASLPTPEALQSAILKAGEAMDQRLTDRLGGLLTQAPPPAAPADGAALQAMVQQAMAEAFPLEELGKILEQKVAKRSEALRNELREVEAELVKAVMKQLEAKPMGEAQVSALIDQRVNQLLLKYVQR